MSEKFYNIFAIFIFTFFSISLFLGLFLNEDASGTGTSNDFKNTWEYVLILKSDYFIDSSGWTRLLPLHYIFLSILYETFGSIFSVRLIFCFISLLAPFLLYLNLRLKFPQINKGKLIILSSLLLILPFFRSSAIWPNPHVLAIIFLLASIYFFQKWQLSENKKLNLNFILHIILLALTLYTRRYYVFLFFYYFLFYIKYLNIKELLISLFIIFLLSIPGLILVYNFPFYLTSSGYSYKFYNTILIISSIFLLYILPFIQYELIKKKSSENILLLIISFIFTIITSYYFDYNPKLGGGYFMKASNMLYLGNYFFYLTAILGIYFILKLSIKNKEDLFLILLVFFTFSNYYMFQKYFEPLLIIFILLFFKEKFLTNFLKSNYQIFFILIYFLTYSLSALINSYYKISIGFFW